MKWLSIGQNVEKNTKIDTIFNTLLDAIFISIVPPITVVGKSVEDSLKNLRNVKKTSIVYKRKRTL